MNIRYYRNINDYVIDFNYTCEVCGKINTIIVENDIRKTPKSFRMENPKEDFPIVALENWFCINCGHYMTKLNKEVNKNIKELKRRKMVKTEMKKGLEIANGEYEFEILSSEEKISEYQSKEISYVNFNLVLVNKVDEDGKSINMRVGFSNNLTAKSQLGQFIAEMGYVIEVGKIFDTEILNGLNFLAYVKNVKKGMNEYAEIKKDTISLVVEAEEDKNPAK